MLKKVERAFKLFKEIYNNDSTIIEKEELIPLENKFKETNYYSPDIPRIMLMGEFKAGKSTLLNALFGKNIAATDIFEMTSWVARYWYAKEEFCKHCTGRTQRSAGHYSACSGNLAICL